MKHFYLRNRTKVHYLLVAGLNTGVGLTAFPILYLALAGVQFHYLTVLVISQVLCVTSAFFTNKYLVFRTSGNHMAEYFRFSAFYTFYFIVNIPLMLLFVEVFHVHPVATQVIISIGIIVSSYYWHSAITFKRKQIVESRSELHW